MRCAPQIPGRFQEPHECDRRASFASADHPLEDVALSEIEVAVADLERALFRDRSHAVVTVPPDARGTLLAHALRERLPGSFPVVYVAAPEVGEDEICERILAELQQEPGHHAEARLLGIVQELASRDSALVLLIGDAETMQAHTLGWLGRLATASRSGLRLVLVVAMEPRSDSHAIAGLVAALGVGAQKVVLHARAERARAEAPARTPFERGELDRGIAPLATSRAPGPAGPDRSAEKAGQPSPSLAQAIRVAQPRRYLPRAPGWPLGAAAALGLALALLGVQLHSAPTAPPEVLREPERIAERNELVHSQVSATARPAPSRPEAKPAGSDDGGRSAGSAPSAARAQPPRKTRAALATPVRTIAVSLNARPWARIEVDGREVGITPLADLPMAPGLHRFRAHLADGRVVERTLRVDAYRNHISFP